MVGLGFLSLALGGLIQFGCTSGSKKSEVESKLSKKEADQVNEYKAEVEIGRNMAGRLLQYYGVVDNTPLIKYINRVGNYVASYGDFPDRKYMFQIIDSDEVNAFACPGGYILVTAGTIRLAKNEAELASILGHEVAHVGLKHMFNTLKSMNEKEMNKAASAVSKKTKKDHAIDVRKRPEAEKSEFGSLVARYLTGAGAGLSVVKAASAGMNVILTKGLDKKLEFEADHEGVKYAINAGYAPFAMPAFLARLQKNKKKLSATSLDQTHPSPKNRILGIAKLLNKMNAKQIAGAYGTSRYLDQKVSLPPAKKKRK
jgi:predicted Zn-dependent protease